MNALKRLWKFISSMRFAIALLLLLALACSLSSLITQGQSYDWYAQRYSERVAALILALRLDDAYHSPWLIAIAGFLCLNLMLCNVLRLPALIRRTKRAGDPTQALKTEGDVTVAGVADPADAFRRLGMKPVACKTAEGREALFASSKRAGLWGAWVCHIGILLLILGFGLGQMTQRQYTVYGVPGDTKPIGDTGCYLTIDDFTIDEHADGSAAQYTSAITVGNGNSYGPSGGSAEISVNHPATLCGMKFYQNATGWAATVDVQKDGAPLQREVVCAGDYLSVADKPGLAIMLYAFYPDYVRSANGMPATASDALNNPAYLYAVYYMDQMVGMNVLLPGEEVTVDAYAITFSDPQRYTLIQVKRDRFTWLALLGGLVTLLGLALAFYVQPARAWAVRDDDGAWTLHGHCPKGGALYRERFLKAAQGKEISNASN